MCIDASAILKTTGRGFFAVEIDNIPPPQGNVFFLVINVLYQIARSSELLLRPSGVRTFKSDPGRFFNNLIVLAGK